ncbi:MAG: hypothetical protein WC824_07755, partial [Bacteroidota bacterium]
MNRVTAVFFAILTGFSIQGLSAGGPEMTRVRIPRPFVRNMGQWESPVQYGLIGRAQKIAFLADGIALFREKQGAGSVAVSEIPDFVDQGKQPMQLECVSLRFVRPSAACRLAATGGAGAPCNMYSGTDSSMWYSGLPGREYLRYENVWDGIDIEYSETNGALVQRIIAAPDADLDCIAFTGVGIGTIEMQLEMTDRSVSPTRSFVLQGDTLSLRPYRSFFEKRKRVESEFTTYFGGNSEDMPMSMTVDRDGNIYFVMETLSTDLPVKQAFQQQKSAPAIDSNYDFYLACLQSDGKTLRYATYLGGSDYEFGANLPGTELVHLYATHNTYTHSGFLQVDHDRTLYFIGNTKSLDFPSTSNAFQSLRPSKTPYVPSATSVVRLDSIGQLRSATWLGGDNWMFGHALSIGHNGNVYALCFSRGTQPLITSGAVQTMVIDTVFQGWWQTGVLLRLSSELDSLIAGTYILTSAGSTTPGVEMRLDNEDNVIIATDWPWLYQVPEINPWFPGVKLGMWILKITPDLSQYVFTIATGGGEEYLTDLDIDKDNSIIVSGVATSSLFKPVRALATGGDHRFVMKFPPTGGTPIFATLLPNNDINTIGSPPMNARALPCGDIFVFTETVLPHPPFVNPMDTMNSWVSHWMLILDGEGQTVRHSGYWHIDDKIRIGGLLTWGSQYWGMPLHIDGNLNMTMMGVFIRPPDITPLRAFQSRAGDEFMDAVLIRTRVPGCEILNCDISAPDDVTITHHPHTLSPERAIVTVSLRNIAPNRNASEIECVVTLPPGI